MGNNTTIEKSIRKVRDFPKKGVLFYDITGLLINPEAFAECVQKMTEIYKDSGITKLAAIEARGFIFASPLALSLGLPVVLVRKKNKLPGKTIKKSYLLEYGEDTIEIHESDIAEGDRFLVVDDLIATGGTIRAACELIESAGAEIHEIFAVIGLPFLDYSSRLSGYSVRTLIDYQSETEGY